MDIRIELISLDLFKIDSLSNQASNLINFDYLINK